MRVVTGLAHALNVPSDRLLRYLGRDDLLADAAPSTESVISTDDRLTDAQKQSMIDVYRAFIAANDLSKS